MTRLYTNNYQTSLNGAITDVATTVTVDSVVNLPAIGSGDTCQLTIDDGTNVEVVTATSVAGSVITITRGQEGTSGTAFADGTTIALRATALGFQDALGADTSPQLQGALDTNANYIDIDSTYGFRDENANEQLLFTRTTSAINYIDITNSITGVGPTIQSKGDDTNVDLKIWTKGTGFVRFNNSIVIPNNSSFHQLTSAGANAILLRLTSSNNLNIGQSNANNVAMNLYGGTGNITLNAGSTEVMRVLTTGRVGIGTTSPGATLDVNGAIHANSISFDSGTNTLDEYEEGTWTVTVDFATTGDLSVVYTSQSGWYKRIGNTVIGGFNLSCTPTHTTASGSFEIKTLPFTSTTGLYGTGQTANASASINYGTGRTTTSILILPSSTSAIIQASGSATTSSALNNTTIASGSVLTLIGNFVYYV